MLEPKETYQVPGPELHPQEISPELIPGHELLYSTEAKQALADVARALIVDTPEADVIPIVPAETQPTYERSFTVSDASRSGRLLEHFRREAA